MHLYELASEYRNLSDMALEVEPESLQAALDDMQGQIEEKVDSCAAIVRELELEDEAITSELKRLTEKRQTVRNNADRLKVYVLVQMKCAEMSRIKGPRFTVAIQPNPEKVVIDDEAKIPQEYWEVQPVLMKKDLAEAMKRGEVITGAHLERGESLRIR